MLQGGADHFRRIDHACLHQVLVALRQRIEALRGLHVLDALQHDRTFVASVRRDPTQRFLDRARDDPDAHLLIARERQPRDRLRRPYEGDAATRDDPFFDGRFRRVHGIFDARLLFLHLGLGRRADFDDGDAPDQLREALLQLLAVVVGRRVLDLVAELCDASRDRFVSVAISSSIALRRSPNTGALTAGACNVPRNLLTTSVASASLSTSSAMISSGLLTRATCSSSGSSRTQFVLPWRYPLLASMRIRPSASDNARCCAPAIAATRRRDVLAINRKIAAVANALAVNNAPLVPMCAPGPESAKNAAMKIVADATALYVTAIGHHPK